MTYFITFEGIDGSGKSTIANQVFLQLKKRGKKVVLTAEPTSTEIGNYVKQCIRTNADPYITALSFTADRILHCKNISTWIHQGSIVLCDRYAESTYAYQGVQLQPLVPEAIKWLQQLAHNQIIIPHRTYLFDIDPKIAMSRIRHRSELIPFEKISFLTEVRNNYLLLATEKRFKILDATKTITALTDECIEDIFTIDIIAD